MILDLIDYRKSGWKVKKGKKETGPKTIKEVQLDFKLEQQNKQAMADQYMQNQRMGGGGGAGG